MPNKTILIRPGAKTRFRSFSVKTLPTLDPRTGGSVVAVKTGHLFIRRSNPFEVQIKQSRGSLFNFQQRGSFFKLTERAATFDLMTLNLVARFAI